MAVAKFCLNCNRYIKCIKRLTFVDHFDICNKTQESFINSNKRKRDDELCDQNNQHLQQKIIQQQNELCLKEIKLKEMEQRLKESEVNDYFDDINIVILFVRSIDDIDVKRKFIRFRNIMNFAIENQNTIIKRQQNTINTLTDHNNRYIHHLFQLESELSQMYSAAEIYEAKVRKLEEDIKNLEIQNKSYKEQVRKHANTIFSKEMNMQILKKHLHMEDEWYIT
ncbi:unnamed protein product [Cunninghamella blakesleeana]